MLSTITRYCRRTICFLSLDINEDTKEKPQLRSTACVKKKQIRIIHNDMVKHSGTYPASILRKSTSGRHRPVSYPDGPMTARYRFT